MSPSDFGMKGAVSSGFTVYEREELDRQAEKFAWKADLTPEEKKERLSWLSQGRGRKGLRIVIVTGKSTFLIPFGTNSSVEPLLRSENFLPKVDGVTRTLARLLEHLRKEGHQCMLLGPGSGMDTYAGHPLVGTLGIPLVVYPGLKVGQTSVPKLTPAQLSPTEVFEKYQRVCEWI